MEKSEAVPFRWRYIMLPLTVLLLSILLTAVFYRQLPAEVAYHFKLNGSPDRWMSRGAIITGMLVLQVFLTLVAGATTWGIVKLGILSRAVGTRIKPERVLVFMGSTIGVPQLVLSFVMLHIFSYNSYQVHIMPIWMFLVSILALATITLGLLFFFCFKGIITTGD